jgi:hypothetical protein
MKKQRRNPRQSRVNALTKVAIARVRDEERIVETVLFDQGRDISGFGPLSRDTLRPEDFKHVEDR